MKTSILHPTKLLALTSLLLLSALSFDSAGAPGNVDLSFDAGSGINGTVRAVVRQSDGKLIVGGAFTTVKGFVRPGLARLHADGSGDDSFNPGQLAGEIFSLALQPDGKVLVGHYSGIARLHSDGSVDPSFSATMQAFSEYDGVYAIAVQPDGNVLIGGQFAAVNGAVRQGFARLNANGTLDDSFNSGADSSYVTGLALQADGKILVTGNFSGSGTNRVGIVRLNANGSRDNSFTAEPHNIQSCDVLALQPDGQVLAAGWFVDRYRVVRLNANGSLDGSFTPDAAINGADYPSVGAIVVQPDGKVLVAGNFRFAGADREAVVRLNPNGSLDGSFDSSTRVVNSTVLSIVQQPDGKVLIGGGFTKIDGTIRNRMARLDVDGSLDISFDPGAEISGDVSSQVSSVVVQPDGKVLIGGWFTAVQGVNRSKIARLNANGTLDTTFDPGTGVATSSAVHSVALQRDGKVVIGGNIGRDGIARLNADGTLDSSFTLDILGIPHPNDCPPNYACWAYPEVITVVAQSDGKVLIAGNFITVVYGQQEGEETYQLTRYFITRFNTDGTRDPVFQTSIGNTTNSQVLAMAPQPDGKAVLAGNFPSIDGVTWQSIIRINSDGTPDNSFAGPTVGGINAVAVQPDGRVLIGGQFSSVNGTNRSQVARLNADGSLDSCFSPNAGILNISGGSVTALALQPDGKVLIGGAFYVVNGGSPKRLARLTANGALDASFNPGTAAGGGVYAIALPQDGNVLIGGSFTRLNGTSRSYVARLNGNSAAPGDVDLSFDPGPGINGTVTALALQPDGKVIIGGAFTMVKGLARSGLARLNADGSGDATFNAGSAVERNVSAIALQADGKVIVTRCVPVDSNSGPGLNYPPVRLNSDGTVDNSFIPNTQSHLSGSGFTSVVIQPDGKVVLGGYFIEYHVDGEGFIYYYERSLLIRLHANGTADSSFAFVSGDFNTWIGAVALQPDGKVLIGGKFFTVSGTNRSGIARLLADGSADASFDPGIGVRGHPNWIHSVAVQADGRVLLGGWFSSINGTNRNGVARLNANGSLDGSFNPGTGANGKVASLALQPDGKVLIGGDFTTVNGTNRNRIARLNADGSLDSHFDPGTGVDGSVRAVVLQPDGKVLIGGNFPTVNGIARPYVARLHGGAGGSNAAAIVVEQPAGTPLVSGMANISFGSVAPGTASDRVFTIRNNGATELTGLGVALDGPNAAAFAPTVAPPTSIAPNGSTTFAIRFTPVNRGTQTATLHIVSNVADESPFEVILIGTGANGSPTAAPDAATTAYQTATEINVLANDSDPEADPLTITAASSGSHGATQITATESGQRIRYTPASGFSGTDTFTYAVSDGVGGSAMGTASVTVGPAPQTQTRTLFSKGGAVPGAGDPSSGVPAGAVWKRFGVPSIAANARVAFAATLGTPNGTLASVHLDDSGAEAGGDAVGYLVSKQGDAAPGAAGATFAAFKDPLLNDAGTIVFLATVRGAPAAANSGIWKNYDTQSVGTPINVARTGAEPAGVPGARWKAFTSVALSDGAPGDELIAFTATMSSGAANVSRANDAGLWIVRGTDIHLALRGGATLEIGSAEKMVKSFVALQPLGGAPGQGNGATTAGVLARVKFSDGTDGVLRVSLDVEGLQLTALVLTGDPVADFEVNIATFNLPTQNIDGRVSLVATLTGSTLDRDTAVLQTNESGFDVIARKSNQAIPGDSGVFKAFSSLVSRSGGQVAFTASLAGGSVNAGNNTGVWLHDGAAVQLIAREGAQPPGTPVGAKWASFPSLALPDGSRGPVFIGKLLVPAAGQPNPARITSTNSVGVWAADSAGTLQLITRTGEAFDTRRKITALTLLSVVPGSPSQTRSFNDRGELAYRATLTDGSQHIITARLP